MMVDLSDPAQRMRACARRLNARGPNVAVPAALRQPGQRGPDRQARANLIRYHQQAEATVKQVRAEARTQRAAENLARLPKAVQRCLHEDRAEIQERRPLLPACDAMTVTVIPASVRSLQARVCTAIIALSSWWTKHRNWQRRIQIERLERLAHLHD